MIKPLVLDEIIIQEEKRQHIIHQTPQTVNILMFGTKDSYSQELFDQLEKELDLEKIKKNQINYNTDLLRCQLINMTGQSGQTIEYIRQYSPVYVIIVSNASSKQSIKYTSEIIAQVDNGLRQIGNKVIKELQKQNQTANTSKNIYEQYQQQQMRPLVINLVFDQFEDTKIEKEFYQNLITRQMSFQHLDSIDNSSDILNNICQSIKQSFTDEYLQELQNMTE